MKIQLITYAAPPQAQSGLFLADLPTGVERNDAFALLALDAEGVQALVVVVEEQAGVVGQVDRDLVAAGEEGEAGDLDVDPALGPGFGRPGEERRGGAA